MASSDLYLQLYSLRHETSVDAEKVLRMVAPLGFTGVELAGDYGWPLARWRALLDETGLRVVSSHQGLEALETNLAERIAFHRALGTHRLVVPGLGPGERQSADGFRAAARRLNVLGHALRREGFALGYHNHDFEFAALPTSGSSTPATCGMDVLLAETDPAAVHLEVDTFWLEYAGRNAIEFLRRHEERVCLVHAKDLRKRDRRDVPAGQGDVDFRALMPLCSANDWPVIVEYEGRNAVESVRQGAAYLRNLPR